MNSNQDNRNFERDNNQQQHQQLGQRPGYDNDKSQHLRSSSYGDTNTNQDGINDQNYVTDLKETERKWNNISTDYRRRYPSLTSEDIDYRQGEFDNMTERIAKRTNRNREDVQEEIRNWDSESDNVR